MGDKRPTKPSDPRVRGIRFQHPTDSTKVIQIDMINTGVVDPGDGTEIWALVVGGSGGPVPALPATIPPNPVIAVTATATALPSQALVSGAVLKAPSGNTNSVWIGGDNTVAIGNGLELEPGEIIPVAAIDMDKFWVIGTAGSDVLQWIGG